MAESDKKHSDQWQWNQDCQQAFDLLKERLIANPILIFPDFTKEFILHTDASGVAIGGILAQFDDEGRERVIAYASRKLSKAEKNYSTTTKECLAVVHWIKYFRPYLYGKKFTLYTDHHSLRWLFNFKEPNTKIMRWILQLSDYDFEIHYRPGARHSNANALSQPPFVSEECEFNVIDEIQSVYTLVEETSSLLKRIRKAQREDPDLLPIIHYIENRDLPDHDGLLGGHLGFKKTYARLREHYWWPRMYTIVWQWVRECEECQKKKQHHGKRLGFLQSISVERRFEKVGIDIVGPLPKTKKGNKYIVVMMDYLTKWPMAAATPNQTAATIANVFLRKVICNHGAPEEVLSEKGTQFTSEIFKKINEILGTKTENTSLYHPQTDGLVEKFNGTLIRMLTVYVNDNQTDWDEYIPFVLWAYRSSPHESTGESTFFMLYGRDPLFPIDISITPTELWKKNNDEDVINQLQDARSLVLKSIKEAQKKQQKYYNKNRKDEGYRIGDKVLLLKPAVEKGNPLNYLSLSRDLTESPIDLD